MERLGSEAERYLRQAVEGLPIWTRAEVQEEIRAHLNDAIQHRMAAGADATTAEQAAVEASGPAKDARARFQQAHRRGRKPWWQSEGLINLTIRLGTLVDWFALIKLWNRRPRGNFLKDYQDGRYDAIIERGERELRERGPRFNLHHELGMAYSCIGELEKAVAHLEAELALRQRKPIAKMFGRSLSLASAYGNLAGLLERLGRTNEAESALRAGLAIDNRPLMLHLCLARLLAARNETDEALRHIEAAATDRTTHPKAKTLLLFSADPHFDQIRSDPRFGRVMLRAVAE